MTFLLSRLLSQSNHSQYLAHVSSYCSTALPHSIAQRFSSRVFCALCHIACIFSKSRPVFVLGTLWFSSIYCSSSQLVSHDQRQYLLKALSEHHSVSDSMLHKYLVRPVRKLYAITNHHENLSLQHEQHRKTCLNFYDPSFRPFHYFHVNATSCTVTCLLFSNRLDKLSLNFVVLCRPASRRLSFGCSTLTAATSAWQCSLLKFCVPVVAV